MPSRRKQRLAEVVRQEVSRVILQELKNPRLGFVTIVRADVAPDVKTAKIYVSVLGDEDTQAKTVRELQAASGFIQAEIGPRLRARNTPVLTFKLDRSVKQSLRVSKLIQQALSEDQTSSNAEPHGATPEPSP